jgi:hypothetical protein
LTRKIERQPYRLMRSPPAETPRAGAAKKASPALIGARSRSSAAPPCPMSSPMASGTMGAPAMPCSARHAISVAASGANAHVSEARVNTRRLAT